MTLLGFFISQYGQPVIFWLSKALYYPFHLLITDIYLTLRPCELPVMLLHHLAVTRSLLHCGLVFSGTQINAHCSTQQDIRRSDQRADASDALTACLFTSSFISPCLHSSNSPSSIHPCSRLGLRLFCSRHASWPEHMWTWLASAQTRLLARGLPSWSRLKID